MAIFTRTYITIETALGKFLRARVTMAEQIQYEKTARANGWKPETDQGISNVFLAWHALKRTGQITETFEQFRDLVVDAAVDRIDVDTETGEEVVKDGDPTH